MQIKNYSNIPDMEPLPAMYYTVTFRDGNVKNFTRTSFVPNSQVIVCSRGDGKEIMEDYWIRAEDVFSIVGVRNAAALEVAAGFTADIPVNK